MVAYCYRLAGVVGCDPRRLTLRKLKRMADARREHDYDVAIAVVCYLGGALGGQFKPTEANPYRQKPPRTPGERAEESREGWELLKGCLKQVAGRRG